MSTDNPNKEDESDNSDSTATNHETSPGDIHDMETDDKDKEEPEDISTQTSEDKGAGEDEDSNILLMPGDKGPIENNAYKGNVPPLLVALYHRI